MTMMSCIIVGGGPGGMHVATTLAKKSNGAIKITVIDRQNYLDWSLASPRMLVQPDDIERLGYVMPLDKVCEFASGPEKNITFVQAACTQIGAKSVKLDNGTTMEADAIVIAVGGQYASGAMWKPLPDQTTKEARVAAFRTLRAKVAEAKSIVVAGAGPTGVEVAGEIKSAFPSIKVTMVGTLLPNSPDALKQRMKTALEGMDIVLLDGQRVDVTAPDENGKVVTRGGECTIEGVDMVLNAAGFAFMGAKLADESIKDNVTDRGQFSCRPTLQLQTCDTVFCCGDILAVPEGCFADVKGLQHADETAERVGKNVALFLMQKPMKEFAWSKVPVQKPMMTALGPNVGIGFIGLPNFLENFMCRQIKCKDYYMSIKAKLYGKGKTW